MVVLVVVKVEVTEGQLASFRIQARAGKRREREREQDLKAPARGQVSVLLPDSPEFALTRSLKWLHRSAG